MLKPLGLTSLKDQVYAQIKGAILQGEFGPGMSIRERELAAELGISRTPIREALLQLGSEGLVVFVPRRGIFVAYRTLGEIEEIYVVLGLLEAHGAKMAIRRIGDAEIERMARLTQGLEEACKRNDTGAFTQINVEVHEAFLSSCGSPRLVETCSKLREQLHQYPVRMLTLPGWMAKSLAEHREILRAFRERRVRQIEGIIRRHWRFKETHEHIVKKLSHWPGIFEKQPPWSTEHGDEPGARHGVNGEKRRNE